MVAIGWYDEDDAESALQSDAPKACFGLQSALQ